MRVSEVIKFWQQFQENHGDKELMVIRNDGQCSWEESYKPSAKFMKSWPMEKNGWLIR